MTWLLRFTIWLGLWTLEELTTPEPCSKCCCRCHGKMPSNGMKTA